jgi:hypothetical protein
MEFTKQNAPISDKKFTSIERMRTNVLEKARERGLEEKINNHFDELLKKEKRKIIGKEVKSAARQFQIRRKQTEANARKEIRDTKKWRTDIAKEEKDGGRKKKDGGRKSLTGKPRHKSGKRRYSDYGVTKEPAKGERRRTVESQRVNGKVKRNLPDSS